jgi:hypothetical protein
MVSTGTPEPVFKIGSVLRDFCPVSLQLDEGIINKTIVLY